MAGEDVTSVRCFAVANAAVGDICLPLAIQKLLGSAGAEQRDQTLTRNRAIGLRLVSSERYLE